VETGVDDLHTGIAQGPSDDLYAAIVAVEAWFGYQYPRWSCRHS
jgi:hypothetical protein